MTFPEDTDTLVGKNNAQNFNYVHVNDRIMSHKVLFVFLCLFVFLFPLIAESKGPNGIRTVSYDELLLIMQQENGYNIAITTNAVRFQIHVAARLIDWARNIDPQIYSIFIGYEVWYRAALKAAGLKAIDAPLFMRIAYKYKQDMRIDIKNPYTFKVYPSNMLPRTAANIKIWWEDEKGAPKEFAYNDLNSVPKLRVINERVITYRFFNFGDMIVCDNIKGLRGRPISGILGVMFKLIGDGEASQIRMAISEDGLQISRAYSKKGFFRVKSDITIFPDGKAIKDIPKNRPDLRQVVSHLRMKLTIE